MIKEDQISGLCPKNAPTQRQGGAQPQASNTLTQGRRMKGAKAGCGWGGFAGELDEQIDILKPYFPSSWFHEVGAWKKRAEIMAKLPNLYGSLFLTFTVDPKRFANEDSAFDSGRSKLRKVFHALRKGTVHNGKLFKIDAPYFTKVEFHENGYAHFHVIFRTRFYLPPKVINRLWGLGRVNVQRIRTRGLEYLLKYVTKAGGLPEWVKARTRIRIVQPSRGFYATTDERKAVESLKSEVEVSSESEEAEEEPKKRELTIGERIEKWKRMAVLRMEGRYRTITLECSFFEILAECVYELARSHRYLGNWVVRINRISDLLKWKVCT